MAILIDSHIHIYPGFSVDHFLDAAWDNFNTAVGEAGLFNDTDYVLALTEGKGCDVFSELKEETIFPENDSGGFVDSSSFSFYRTAESETLVARKGEARIVLIAGRQIISRENIEVLSLFNSIKEEDRTLSLTDLAQVIADKGGLPVLPWGAGKWWGERGRAVADLIHSNYDYPLFLADNGNRPSFWPEPALLRQAREIQIPILSGSDPLPLTSHVNRPGSSGVVLPDGELSRERPAACLSKLLVSEKEIVRFGGRMGSLSFIIDQLQINVRNRTKRGKSGDWHSRFPGGYEKNRKIK
jgi:hypothetical protein